VETFGQCLDKAGRDGVLWSGLGQLSAWLENFGDLGDLWTGLETFGHLGTGLETVGQGFRPLNRAGTTLDRV
jgi:hypothetical protein